MARAGGKGRAFAESEVLRYLSLPAQATAYKLGERSWLTGRLGPLGLDRLERELTAIANAPQ
jgi:hypothetical protein